MSFNIISVKNAVLIFIFYYDQSVSPELLSCRDLELAVPGTYRAGECNCMVGRTKLGYLNY